MRAVAVLSVCVILACAVVANAAVYTINNTSAGGTLGQVTETRTPVTISGTTFDQVDWTLTSFSGAASGAKMVVLGGTFSAAGGTYRMSSSTSWTGATTNGSGNGDAPVASPTTVSWVNMGMTAGTIADGTWARTGSGNAYSSFTGAWLVWPDKDMELRPGGPLVTLNNPTENGGEGMDHTYDTKLLSRMFVTPGAQVTYTGNAQFSTISGLSNISINPVPEPGTLALLACGAMGLLVFAWRRRK